MRMSTDAFSASVVLATNTDRVRMFEQLPWTVGRLRLRTLREDDLPAFHAYRSDPAVARFQGWSPMTLAEAAAFLRAQLALRNLAPGSWVQLGIASLASDSLVGDAGVWLSGDGTRAEFGLSIAPAVQGRGHGTEAVQGLIALLFASTAVLRIEASADLRNLPCLGALGRAGMVRVATREAEYKGERCTEQVFIVHRPAA